MSSELTPIGWALRDAAIDTQNRRPTIETMDQLPRPAPPVEGEHRVTVAPGAPMRPARTRRIVPTSLRARYTVPAPQTPTRKRSRCVARPSGVGHCVDLRRQIGRMSVVRGLERPAADYFRHARTMVTFNWLAAVLPRATRADCTRFVVGLMDIGAHTVGHIAGLETSAALRELMGETWGCYVFGMAKTHARPN